MTLALRGGREAIMQLLAEAHADYQVRWPTRTPSDLAKHASAWREISCVISDSRLAWRRSDFQNKSEPDRRRV